jgi:hypothetical protein
MYKNGAGINFRLFSVAVRGFESLKGSVCSYDRVEVSEAAFVLNDGVGEIYFCNLRCFCIWAVQIATKPKLSEADKQGEFGLKTPEGEELHFSGIIQVAMWAALNALKL